MLKPDLISARCFGGRGTGASSGVIAINQEGDRNFALSVMVNTEGGVTITCLDTERNESITAIVPESIIPYLSQAMNTHA